MANPTFKKHLSERSTWLRGLYMLLFAFIYNVAEVVMIAVALFQFIMKLLTGKTHPRVAAFAQSLCVFLYQVWQFLTFTSEALPFPFASWPASESHRDVTQPPL
jgi:hypothetical protein